MAARPCEPLPQRTVGGAVEQAAGHDGGGGQDRHVVTGLGQVHGRPEAAPVTEVVEDEDAPAEVRGAVQDVVERDDVRGVHPGEPIDERQGPLEAGPGGHGPGGHDDLVGGRGDDRVGVQLDPEPDLHAERGQAPLEPVEQVDDLATRRLEPGETELPTEAVAAFDQA